MAIDRDVVVAARPRGDGRVTARSDDLAGAVDVAADGSDDRRRRAARVGPQRSRGVVQVLADLGRAPVGADLDITSTVPIGARTVVERGVLGRASRSP